MKAKDAFIVLINPKMLRLTPREELDRMQRAPDFKFGRREGDEGYAVFDLSVEGPRPEINAKEIK